MTYQAIYATGWKAVVQAETADEARARLARVGRGEAFTVLAGGTHRVWDEQEADDDQDEDE
jgi:hypothetical protein